MIFHCSEHLWKAGFDISMLCIHFIISTFKSSLFQFDICCGKWKKVMMQGRVNMEVAARVVFCVWLRNVAETEMSAWAHWCGGFASPVITNFLCTCAILHHRDSAKLVNNIPLLLFAPLE
jgi:hypothetical protein